MCLNEENCYIFSETAWPIKAKFYVEPPVCSVLGKGDKFAMYGKIL